MPKILGWQRPGTIGRRQHEYSSIAQPVEHAAVNRRVVGSSPTWGANYAFAAVIFLAAAKLLTGPLAQLVRATGS